MNLIIEQGNTSSKIGICEDGQIKDCFVYKNIDRSTMNALFEKYTFTKGIFSTVVDADEDLMTYLKSKLKHFVFFDEHVALPLQVNYETPNTLGKDRLAAVVGANYLCPNRNVLVIDAGTAITYEMVEASGIYIGGNISPGMTTRFRALNQFTKKLPLLVEDENIPQLGVSTKTAIQAGVVNGIVFEMDGYIDMLRAKYHDLLVFLTGGHSFYFERRLKNSIFADINLVLTGLNRILEYNVED